MSTAQDPNATHAQVRPMMAMPCALATILLLAGCAAPAATRDDAAAMTLPSATDVDLHDVALDFNVPGSASSTSP